MSEVAAAPAAAAPAAPAEAPAQPAVDAKAAPPKPAEAFRKVLKIDGKEVVVDSEEKLHALAMKGFGSEKRFAEAARLRKEAEERAAKLKEDPWSVLEELGLDPDDLATKRLSAKMQREMLTPEQREAAELKKKLEAYEAKEKAAKEEAEKTELTAAQEKYQAELSDSLPKVLAASGLPKTERSIVRIAEKMRDNLKHGIDLPPERLAEEVREEYLAEFKELFGAMDPDALLKTFDGDILKKLRRADLSRLKPVPSVSSAPQPRASDGKPGQRFKDREDYERHMEELKRGR